MSLGRRMVVVLPLDSAWVRRVVESVQKLNGVPRYSGTIYCAFVVQTLSVVRDMAKTRDSSSGSFFFLVAALRVPV